MGSIPTPDTKQYNIHMWNKILGFNSFVIMPLTCMYLVYTGMQGIFYWDWKPFWFGVVFFIIALIVHVVLAILND